MALSNLPRGLEETYARCLQRVGASQQQYSLRVLRYVYEAKPPLVVEALGEALATDPDTGELSIDDIPVYASVLRAGANLIIFDEVERLVIPAHHSVRNFLHRSKVPILKELEPPLLGGGILNLGDMCISHLLWHTSDTDGATDTDTDTDIDADADKARPEDSPKADQTPPSPSGKLSNWIKPSEHRLRRLLNPWFSKRKTSTPRTISSTEVPINLTLRAKGNAASKRYRPFHDYARSNWISLSRELTIESMAWLKFERLILLDLEGSRTENQWGDSIVFPWKSNSSSSLGSKILGWAICSGHMPLLELGMRLQEDLSLPLDDHDGLLPLHLAAKVGHVDVFARMYTRDDAWSLDIWVTTGRAALHYAAEQGHSGIVGFLLGPNKMTNLTAVEEPDREHHTPLYLAVSSGSVTTIQTMESKCGSVLWELRHTENLLDALNAGGSLPEIVSYVVGRMKEVSDFRRDARILAWVVRTNAVGLVPCLVNAGVSLNTNLDSIPTIIDQEAEREISQEARPALFSAFETSTPHLAFAFIENGASSEISYSHGDYKISPIDLALSRGWTSLASAMCPRLSNHQSSWKIEITIQAASTEVRWLSVLTEGWVVTGVACDSHSSCSFASGVVAQANPHFLYAAYQDDGSTHSLRFRLECTDLERAVSRGDLFKFMMEPRSLANIKSSPSLRRKPAKPITIGIWGQSSLTLDFQDSPFSMQHVHYRSGSLYSSPKRITIPTFRSRLHNILHLATILKLASLLRRGMASMTDPDPVHQAQLLVPIPSQSSGLNHASYLRVSSFNDNLDYEHQEMVS